MTDQNDYMSTKEFSEISGIPSSTITKLLREEKIKGEKQSRKWAIPRSELKAPVILDLIKKEPGISETKKKVPGQSKTYTVTEFAQMTYLTEKGITDWLTKGLISGEKNSQGEWQVHSSNLEVPNIKRLVREV